MQTLWPALVLVACNGSPGTTADGGTIYTSTPPEDISCNVDSDCCVVTDGCRAAAYVVHAGDAVQIPKPSSCVKCIGPMVQVWCSNGKCKSGQLVDPSAGSATLSQDHCGPVPLSDAGDPTLIGEDGGIVTMAAYGCNP